MISDKNIQRTKEWSISARSFSLKVEGGCWSPFGEFLKLPSGVNRYRREYKHLAGGWIVTVTTDEGLLRKRFSDSVYSESYLKSLEAAIAWLRTVKTEVYTSRKKVHIHESGRKKVHNGVPGVAHAMFPLSGGGYRLCFVIRCGRALHKQISVGHNIQIGSKEYEEGLKRAIKIREELRRDYVKAFSFKDDVAKG